MEMQEDKIYHLDCNIGIEYLIKQEMKVDVIMTSPPYNIGKKYSKYDDSIPRDEYLVWMDNVARNICNVMSDNTSFFLNIGNTPKDQWIAFDVANIFRKYLKLQNTIHWIKSISINENGNTISVGHYKPINSKRFVNDTNECIFHFTKRGDVILDRLAIGVPFKDKSNVKRWKTNDNDLRCRGNSWYIPYKTIQQSKTHPAYFPITIPEMCIKLHGIERTRLVLDPFMGSGSTAVACKQLNVHYIGFEIDRDYINLSHDRLRKLVNKNLI